MIHSTAIVDSKAEVDENVQIGPYAIVGPDVRVASGCHIMHHASVSGHTLLESDVVIHPFASVGGVPQDLKYTQGEICRLDIGERTILRESVTVNAGTDQDVYTKIGSDCLLMAYAHVGHNSILGNHVILANAATLGGHVVIGDGAIIGGLVGVHQFVHIGGLAILGGCSKVVQDIPPYMMADGNPARVRTINQVGLERQGFQRNTMQLLKKTCTTLFHRGHSLKNAILIVKDFKEPTPEVEEVLSFISKSNRGIARGIK